MKKPIVQKKTNETIVIYTYGKKTGKVQLGRTKDNFERKVIIPLILLGLVGMTWSAMFAQAQGLMEPKVVTKTVEVVAPKTLPPILHKIAVCESGNQHTVKGKVVKGKVNQNDTGKFQINSVIWEKKAKALGFDIYTEAGNEAFAHYLFENYGSVPWRSSSGCWIKK